MDIPIRTYHHEADFERVGAFLIKSYRPRRNLRLWVQPRWEYMHFHPLIKETDIGKIAIAEYDQEIVGVVHHEHDEGEIFFQVDHNFDWVTKTLFDYAERNYGKFNRASGEMELTIMVNEEDYVLQELAKERGFVMRDVGVTSRFDLTAGVPEVELANGFKLQSLAEENELRKVNQVLWRGFNHEGPAPEEDIAGRQFMQQAPNFRHDLTIVAVAPNGDYASFCGIWYVPENHLTYVEPVATDPSYRRMGLGKAVVLEGLRRTIPLGAELAWVGSNQEFYLSMGFEESYSDFAWSKTYRSGN